MSEVPQFDSFEEFWPYYVREHAQKTTRTLHAVGTTLAAALFAYGLVRRRPRALLLAPVVGYGFAWIGHFFVENNRPATFRYPLWSLRGDLRMLAKIYAGTMDAEVARVMSEPPAWEREGNGRGAGHHDAPSSSDVN